MKLELKHLASYLPHGLNIKDVKYGSVFEALHFITTPHQDFSLFKGNLDQLINDEYLKPILFPLSEYYSEENRYGGYIAFRDFKYEVINKRISLKVYEDLLKNKFDVFGLIDEGLAIPATEDFNPYK